MTVCFGGLMLLGGRIADRYGARRLTLTGLVVFIGASLLSGLAAGPAALLAGRALQGTGAALHADGYSALRVGVSFIPVAVATVAGAHTASQVLAKVPARAVAVAGLALAAAGYGIVALWPWPAQSVIGMSVAALGIGCCFVTAFTASLTDAPAAEGGLRGALVNTFHELGGAGGVAMLSAIAGAAMVAARPAASAFRGAFTAGAACALAAAVSAAFIVPSVLRSAGDGRPAH
jgi:hypothetical protein